jgi:hypothetical protein
VSLRSPPGFLKRFQRFRSLAFDNRSFRFIRQFACQVNIAPRARRASAFAAASARGTEHKKDFLSIPAPVE